MKWISPLLYSVQLVVLTGLTIGAEAVARSIGVLATYQGSIDVQTFLLFDIAILVFGIPVFWVTNLLINRLERTVEVTKGTHFRQSAGFYLVGFISLFNWINSGFGNTEEDGYLLIWLGISVVGIVMNYLFLRRLQKISTT